MQRNKLYKIIFKLFCLFVFIGNQANAQSAEICAGDSVVVRMNCSYTGNLLWQQSNDLVSWSAITGAVSDSLKVMPDSTTFYRAIITNGTCQPVYSDIVNITVHPIPPAPILTVLDHCDSSTLTASAYTGTLLWSTGQIVNPITVTTAGAFTVNQTINGCTSPNSSAASAPLPSPSTPSISVIDSCGISKLTAGSYTGTLLWNNGQTTNSINTSSSGTYILTQTLNGCASAAATAIATPTVIPPAPTITVTDNCGISVLTASNTTGTLLWSTAETTSSIAVTVAGTFTVTQTANGCTSPSASAITSPIPLPPAPSVSVTDNCGNSVLTAGGYTGTLLWSTGQTVNPITVTVAGTITVKQTLNGCISLNGSGTAAPAPGPPAPVISVIDSCGNSKLTAASYTGTLLWNTGQTASSINTSSAGTYTLIQTVNGCTSIPDSAIASPITIPAAPTITVTDTCGSSLLTAGNITGNLLWSTSQTTNSINVTSAGTYTVTQTANGCTSPSGSAVAAPIAIPSAPAVSVIDSCGNSKLTVNNVNGTLLWSTGQTINPVIVTTAGTITVTQTANGCTSATGSGTTAPIAIPSAPSISVVDNCGNSVLTASGFTGTLLWSNSQTTNPITVNTAGSYTVAQTISGCSSTPGTATATPGPGPAAPTVSVVNNCGNSVLTASGFTGTLLWSNGQTTNSITVTTAGSYTVTQTINGCSSTPGSGTAAPNPDPAAPSISVMDNCGNSVLTASGFTGSLAWSNGQTTNVITVTTAGTYTVTQTINGCTSPVGSATASPVANPAAPTINKCGNILTASGYTGTLLWSNGQTGNPITVNASGTYSVTQTVSGCTSSSSNSVTYSTSSNSQFASSVLSFSSEWASPGWKATEALSAPNTCSCGDITTAWASATSDGQREFLVLGFTTPQAVSQITIYETFNPGAIDTVYLRNSGTMAWNVVWTGTAAPATPCPRSFVISMPTTGYTANAIRIAINSPAISSWNEIDAVEIQ